MLFTAVIGVLTFLGRSIGTSLVSRITTVRKVVAASVATATVITAFDAFAKTYEATTFRRTRQLCFRGVGQCFDSPLPRLSGAARALAIVGPRPLHSPLLPRTHSHRNPLAAD